MVQLSHLYMTTRKTVSLTIQKFVGKVMSLLFNTLSRFIITFFFKRGKHLFPGDSEVKASAWNAGDPGLIPGLGKIPWRRKWQPTPVLLPGESHGGRSLVGYSPWGHKESDTTEQIHFTSLHGLYNNNVSCLRTVSLS